MPSSTRSSNASAPCRLEWRPSRRLAAALVLIGALAAWATLASELPLPLAVLFAAAALSYSAWLARRELRSRPQWMVVAADAVRLDGVALDQATLEWRGPLALLRYRDGDGRPRQRIWWPDTLDAAGRRELRLAWPVQAPTPDSRSMAP
ncbi:hypothetical protein ASD78_11990 [Lysobacter sp. Root667]|uniref:hypothetical protein n=1 Tax=Lysobacter sp. Root667 TaxID=1736581 RepID=UPI0006F823DE|nr:hypothetical protein [Lysobacter sp. Root667]KRA74213.1 hypothetical protein ASD78_11990 [Lysobacter sp. Root667]